MADTLEVFGVEFTGVNGIKAYDDNEQLKTFIRPQGTKSITANGQGIDVASYESVNVAVPGGSATLQEKSKSYTPTESAQSETVSPDTGYDGLSSVAVSVGAISSTYVGSGIDRNDSTDLTASGATVTAPAGYYENAASKSVASGTEGTPTATKGTVSNHAISVTPSVTNVAGYISGGTHTGTAVSVSASELVSGTYTVSSSGTKDVTNYASASVPAGTAGTPSASKGTVSNHSVSVTPSVTNTTGWITGDTKTGTAVTVSASELVSGSETKTQNGTYNVTNLAELVVNVSGGGGGSSYTLLASREATVNTSSTTATILDIYIDVPWTASSIIYVRVRDKAGKRAGYFYGTDTFILNVNAANNSTASSSLYLRETIRYNSDNVFEAYISGTSQYGIYPYQISTYSDSGRLSMYSRYSSSNSLTINGTYKIDVYTLATPDNVSPFA